MRAPAQPRVQPGSARGKQYASLWHRVGYGQAAIAGAAGPIRAAGRYQTVPIAGRQAVRTRSRKGEALIGRGRAVGIEGAGGLVGAAGTNGSARRLVDLNGRRTADRIGDG